MVTNPGNTFFHFKRLHGRLFEDHVVQTERASLPYELVPLSDGRVGLKVNIVDLCVIGTDGVIGGE